MVILHWNILDPKVDPPPWWAFIGMFCTPKLIHHHGGPPLGRSSPQNYSTTMVGLHWDVLHPKIDLPPWWASIGMFLTPKLIHHRGGPPLGRS